MADQMSLSLSVACAPCLQCLLKSVCLNPTSDQAVMGSIPARLGPTTFSLLETDNEIFSTIILSLC